MLKRRAMRGIERNILEKAMEAFRRRTKLEAQIIDRNLPNGRDGLIRITAHGRDYRYVAEVKGGLTPATLGATIHQLNPERNQEETLIVTRYVTPQMAENLLEMGINFIDAAGNALINDPPLYVFIKGMRLLGDVPAEPPFRAFRMAGLKTIFLLLGYPDMINAPFRKIAKGAGVALGTVAGVMNELKKLGHLLEIGMHNRRLQRKSQLLNRWVTAYPEQLRPKLIAGTFRIKDRGKEWWPNLELPQQEAFWGGETAANTLTGYLKPERVTIYARKPFGGLILRNRLVKDPRGNIDILEVFWGFEYNWDNLNLAHPILIYADLLATGDPRNIEVAKLIYDQELRRFIRED